MQGSNPRFRIEQRGRATVGTIRGQTHTHNEDRFRLLTSDVPLVGDARRGEMFAVFDGMGGLRLGMHAAQHMADLLIEFFEAPDRHDATVRGLRSLLIRGSREIASWEKDPGSRQPAGGCVGTVAWLTGNTIQLLHLGDTEGWISHQCGHSEQVTDTHALGRRVTQFFGMPEEPQIQTITAPFSTSARLLLATDGLRNARAMNRVAALLALRQAPSTTVAEICGVAQAGRAPDDVTALLVVGT